MSDDDCIVVPTSLHRKVLQHLHAAHQGTSAMEQCARAIVFWPGMSKDICETWEGCCDCNRNAPSHAATPPLPALLPSTPFEAIFADFFDHGGCHYLVVSDRLSGWVEILSSTSGTDLEVLRVYCGTSEPSLPHSGYQRNSPAMVALNSSQAKQRISTAYGASSTGCHPSASLNQIGGQKWQ